MSDKRIKALLVIMMGFLYLIFCSDAFALPSFARQTGMECTACHTVWPELTPVGRLFKLNGYVLSKSTKSYEFPPPVGDDGTILLNDQSAPLDFANFKGTIGTQFTISGSGFGTMKPALYYQQSPSEGLLKSAGVKIISYSDTSITCIWNKKLPAATYNLFVKPKIKGASFIPGSAISIMNPVIDEVDPRSGSYKDIITIKGQFFSIKKPKVYLENPDTLKRIKCNVLNFTMDPITGISSLQFIVPKQGYAGHTVVVQNIIGGAKFVGDAVTSQ